MTSTRLSIPRGRSADAAHRMGHSLRVETSAAAQGVASIRLGEFLLFFLLVVSGTIDAGIAGTNLPLAAILGYSLLRKPVYDLGRFQALPWIFAVMLTYVGIVSLFADPGEYTADWQGRLLRMAAVCILVLVTATGRIDLRSAIYGFCAALLLNVPLFYMGLLPDLYGGFLTGFVGDKNVAGLSYCLFGLLAIAVARRTSHRLVLLTAFGACVWLTGSRTSIAAYIAACCWIVLAPRLPLIGRWALGAATAYLVWLTAEDFSQIGVFSDRQGSDLLRARIDAASVEKVEATGFFGRGLGEAWVPMDDGRWFFHNSYWTALVEGGWPWTIALVGLTALVMLRPFTASMTEQQVHAQALGVAVLICATRLGEVFLTIYWAIPLAFAVQCVLTQRLGSTSIQQDRAPSPRGEDRS